MCSIGLGIMKHAIRKIEITATLLIGALVTLSTLTILTRLPTHTHLRTVIQVDAAATQARMRAQIKTFRLIRCDPVLDIPTLIRVPWQNPGIVIAHEDTTTGVNDE